MAIFDFLKKEEAKKEIEKPKKVVKKSVVKKKKTPSPVKVAEKKITEKLSSHRYSKHYEEGYRVLKSVHITEKATELAKKNQYIFKVFENTNKQEIKKVVESIYKVDVVSVRIINIHRKKKRLGKSIGWKQGYKKAIIKVKKGQEIEILPR
jgi:large subunit ribosomal protein L23